MSKINCMFHPDSTASLHIYADHAYCFGCNKRFSLDEVGMRGNGISHKFGKSYTRKEDIAKSLTRINNLPQKYIRGLQLPYDETGYYIVYPGMLYYVKRLWEGTNSDKYRSPAGHFKELYKVRNTRAKHTLVLIEGQINALTVDTWCDNKPVSIASPGSANDLNNRHFFDYYLQFDKVCLIVDKDAAGTVCALALRDKLVEKGKRVVIYAMPKDFNDILNTEGEDAVVKTFEEALSLL